MKINIYSIVWLLKRANGTTAKQIFQGSYDTMFASFNDDKYTKIKTNRINEARDLGYITTPNADNWNFHQDVWTITKHGNKFSYSESIDNWYLGYKSS